MTARKTDPPGENTVKVLTPAYSGLNTPSATAQCPAGTVCTGGGIVVPDYGMIVTDSRLTEDGTGWYASFAGGPSGATAVVYADCEPVSPSET